MYIVFCCDWSYPDLKARFCSIVPIINVYTIVIGLLCNHFIDSRIAIMTCKYTMQLCSIVCTYVWCKQLYCTTHVLANLSKTKLIEISIQISLVFLPRGLIDNESAFVLVMAWRWTGLPSSRTHISGTWGSRFKNTNMIIYVDIICYLKTAWNP